MKLKKLLSQTITFMLCLIGSACVTIHDGDSVKEIVKGISSSCTINRTPNTPFYKIQMTFENQTNEFIDIRPITATIVESKDSKILDAEEILAFNEGRILNEKIDAQNAALAAIPVAALTLGAIAASSNGRSNFGRGAATGALLGVSAGIHANERALRLSELHRGHENPSVDIKAYDPQHILGPRSIVPPKLAIRRNLILQSNSILSGTELIRFCRKEQSEDCYHIRLSRHLLRDHTQRHSNNRLKPSYQYLCRTFGSAESENKQSDNTTTRTRPTPPIRKF